MNFGCKDIFAKYTGSRCDLDFSKLACKVCSPPPPGSGEKRGETSGGYLKKVFKLIQYYGSVTA